MLLRTLACAFTLILFAANASGSSPALVQVLDFGQKRHALDDGMKILRDPTGTLTLSDVLALDTSEFTRAMGRRDLHFGYTSDHMWLIKDVRSGLDESTPWIIELEYPYLDRVTLYVKQAGQWRELRSGGNLPVAERVIRHRQPIFPLTLEAGESARLVFHVQAAGSMTLNTNAWQSLAFFEESDRHYIIMSAYYGMLLALGLYNFLLFLGIRQLSFLLYACFVFSFSAGVLTINGIGPLVLWPNLGEPGNRILPSGFTLSATFAFLFARSFLDTRHRAPLWDKVLIVGAVLGSLATLASFVIPVQRALWIMSSYGLLTTVVLLSCGLTCAFRRVPGARIFVLAWSMLLLGTSLLALRNVGVLPSNFLTVYSIQIGSALEMLLLSLGLAARFNELKRQKAAAQQAMVETLKAQEVRLERMVADRTRALEEANDMLAQQALKDPLTGLLNRAGLTQQLDSALHRAARNNQFLAVMMIDLDGFKPINDTHGHDAGDQVLITVAQRLKDCARGSDMIARFGGDEFVVIAEGIASPADAMTLSERILAAIQQPIELKTGQQVRVSASIGVTYSDADAQDTTDQLLKKADNAMYQRKREGKSGISVTP